ncbi:initiation factor 2 subunit family protein [Cryptosporidium serpentis]
MNDKKKAKDDWRVDVDNLIELLRRRQLSDSQSQGRKILEVLRQIVDRYPWKSAYELYQIIRKIGNEISTVDPLAFIVGNVVRRLLNVIRKEYAKLTTSQIKQPTYFDNMNLPDICDSTSVSMSLLRSAVFEGINELLHELGQSWDFDSSLDIFQTNDTILVYGYSSLVERLLRSISKKRQNLIIFVVDGDPERKSEEFVVKISHDINISAILISDSSIFNIMPKVNKVILSASAIFPDGGAVTLSGGYLIAQTASYFFVPVVMISALYKLYHFPLFDYERTNSIVPPNIFMNLLKQIPNVHFAINKFDLVPGNLISIFITENGSLTPSHLYELSKSRFHLHDIDLDFDYSLENDTTL